MPNKKELIKLLVLGGSGFVGRAICREAAIRNWAVTSLNRRGAPNDCDEHLKRVNWIKGDALNRNQLAQVLQDQTFVAHAIGTLFEGEGIFSIYKKYKGSFPSDELSYEKMNRDTLLFAGSEARLIPTIKAFAYVSASNLTKFLLPKYIETKREAEVWMLENEAFRPVILRPGFIYGQERKVSYPLAAGFKMATLFTAGLVPPALSVETVARALINALIKPPLMPVLEVKDIMKIGNLNYNPIEKTF